LRRRILRCVDALIDLCRNVVNAFFRAQKCGTTQSGQGIERDQQGAR
jgi:hypothetical protein